MFNVEIKLGIRILMKRLCSRFLSLLKEIFLKLHATADMFTLIKLRRLKRTELVTHKLNQTGIFP